uniref:Uncharacterized protein n=1 Tax=Haplochromis burtoni TaxID=8153 RepID=A0A3Q3C519_HAPBU
CFDKSCGSSGWTYLTLGIDIGGSDPLGFFSVKFGMATSNATSAHVPTELSGHQLVTYLNTTGPEDVVQIETGYIDKNVWLDWITYTAKSNDMTECVACSRARPTLFTVPAPLLFWEDRPGFDCMLQLHMKERVDRDCITLGTPLPRKGVIPPVFSPRAVNYTCLTRVSVTPIGAPGEAWCDKVIDVIEWANMSSINVARADLGWSGACTVVRLALPIVLAGSHATAETHVGRTCRATSEDFDLTKNSPTYIDFIGVPDEYELANQVAGRFESIFLWITPNKNVDRINYVHYNVQRLANLTRDAVAGLSEQLAATSLMASQNRVALDMLLAEKGGVCAMVDPLALEGLRMLSTKMTEDSGINNPWDDWFSNHFGKYKTIVVSLLMSIATFVAILTCCGCCFIPCLCTLVQRLITTPLTKEDESPKLKSSAHFGALFLCFFFLRCHTLWILANHFTFPRIVGGPRFVRSFRAELQIKNAQGEEVKSLTVLHSKSCKLSSLQQVL